MARRLAKEDRLNTWLFNRRISQEWCHETISGSFIISDPERIAWYPNPLQKIRSRRRGYHTDHGGFNGKNKTAKKRTFLLFSLISNRQHPMWISSPLSWNYLVFKGCSTKDMILALELSFSDPNRDIRALRDITVIRATIKTRALRDIKKKDHHLFDYFKAKKRWAATRTSQGR